MCKNLLGPIFRHQFSYFFSWACISKEFCTILSFLTKACQFSVVQVLQPVPPHAHQCHTVTYSVLVVPFRKLIQYSCCQGRGDTHHHLVGIHPQNHLYCTILRMCVHIMHESNLIGTSSQSCSSILYHVESSQYTTIQYTFFIVLQNQVAVNAVLACITLVPCIYSHYTYYTNGRAMCHLSGALLPCWRSIQE